MENSILFLLNEHKKALGDFEKYSQQTVLRIANLIISCTENGGIIYLCGNGGSAADCQHIAGEFVGRFRKKRHPLPAVSLTTDTSVLTCIGNDYNYDDIFVRQVQALIHGGDILWAFSTSGASPNIIKAVKEAKKKGATIIAFTGKTKSDLEKLSDGCLCSNTKLTSTAQELHLLAYHIICELVDIKLMKVKHL